MSNSSDDNTGMAPEVETDAEFTSALTSMKTALSKRVTTIQNHKQVAKETSDPDLAAVRCTIADRKAGLVDPRNSPLWEHGVVN